MKLNSLLGFIILCSLLLVSSCSQEPVFERERAVYKIGDDPAWANKDWNDSRWQGRPALVPDGQIFWFRIGVDLKQAPEAFQPYGIQLEVYGEYEVFWDGVLIGKNGNPGQEEALGPEGKLWTTYSIPTELTDGGEHVVAIRASIYHFPDHTAIYAFKIDYYDDLLTDQLIETSYMHSFAGAFLMAAFYFLFLFLSDRKQLPMLIFSISCFLFLALTMTHFVGTALPIHYSLHVVRLQTIVSLMLCISFTIPLYFSMHFPFPKRKLVLSIYAGLLAVFYFFSHDFFDFTALSTTLGMWVFSVVIVIMGVYRKEKGAQLVLLVLLLAVIISLIRSVGFGLFAGFSLTLLSMFYLLSLRLKQQRVAYETSLVQSTRLRLELLKKNIQPHFLMNTLTSLIDWVEEAPKMGVKFIEALAKEFDLLNQIEDQTLIPISQEIALCRTHLEIMGYRKEINYRWEEEGIDANQKVPPAVLHTLLENGITHSQPGTNNSVKFKLIYKTTEQYKTYTFLTLGAVVSEANTKKEGTGLKYIKARLTESYDTNWELTSEPAEHGWKSVIKIYHKQA